jgi:hypothetical protein
MFADVLHCTALYCTVLLCSLQCRRSEPSRPFKISVTGSKADIKVKGSDGWAALSDAATQAQLQRQASQRTSRSARVSMQACNARAAYDAAAAAAVAGAGGAAGLPAYDPELPAKVKVQRLYEFAAEVWAAPADGPFRATKVVSIKSKYILFNDTGMVLEYKQKNTPDPAHPGYVSYGDGRRFAGLLQPQERCVESWLSLLTWLIYRVMT